jgi:hypothetical protein
VEVGQVLPYLFLVFLFFTSMETICLHTTPSVNTQKLKFPKRFEMDGLDPYQLKVVVIKDMKKQVFENLEEASKVIDFDKLHSPMADKHEGVRCVRFECPASYDFLSGNDL